MTGIQTVFIDRLPSRNGLSEETSAAAKHKLENFYYKVGDPDEWIDHSGVEIGTDAVANLKYIAGFLDDRLRARTQRPVTHDQFNTESTLPIVVNAAYNTTYNSFDVPAAIQQPPVLEPETDAPIWVCRQGGIIAGLSPSQRCFIAWSQMRTWKPTEQFIRTIVAADGHPPAEYRAYAPLQHVKAFYEALDITEGDPMWLPPEQRVNAW
ncbi:M13-type metalloendopeptidase [Fluviibacterium sp. DFM31]|uniref:M13-type metalloendopeptidase n=1 Tax=Meridianimarinicoccus marinus TaxID=3231483 RepID=A0ABV3L8G3_9RHOB